MGLYAEPRNPALRRGQFPLATVPLPGYPRAQQMARGQAEIRATDWCKLDRISAVCPHGHQSIPAHYGIKE